MGRCRFLLRYATQWYPIPKSRKEFFIIKKHSVLRRNATQFTVLIQYGILLIRYLCSITGAPVFNYSLLFIWNLMDPFTYILCTVPRTNRQLAETHSISYYFQSLILKYSIKKIIARSQFAVKRYILLLYYYQQLKYPHLIFVL